MNEAFVSAAKRHWEDAQTLFLADRLDNTAYLSGYTVECSLKVLVEAAGAAPKPLGHELAALAGDALLLACLMAPAIRRYQFPQSADFDGLKQCWNPEIRYSVTGQISSQQAQACLHAAEQSYCAIVIESVLDGWSELP